MATPAGAAQHIVDLVAKTSQPLQTQTTIFEPETVITTDTGHTADFEVPAGAAQHLTDFVAKTSQALSKPRSPLYSIV